MFLPAPLDLIGKGDLDVLCIIVTPKPKSPDGLTLQLVDQQGSGIELFVTL